MQFDLRSAVVTIGPFEPALLLSLALACFVAWFTGRGLARLTGRVADPWRRRLYVGPVWVLVALFLFVLPNVILVLIFPLLHSEYHGALACVAIVWPTFLLPTTVGLATAARRVRSLHASPGRNPA